MDVLVVCEKNSVAKAVASFLGNDGYKIFSIYNVPCYAFNRDDRKWIVVGVRGHLMDFDFPQSFNNWDLVDPRELFKVQPIRVIRDESVRYVEALKMLGRNAEEVILALDADVEGEGIAFEVMEVIRSVNPHAEFKRALFSSLDENELSKAFKDLKPPLKPLADKCFARSMIDLVVGASFTRLLTLKLREGKSTALPRGHFISYGPCQSPTLYLVIQRALEREKFQSQKFYRVVAKLKVGDRVIEAEHVRGRFSSREEAEKVKAKIETVREAVVEDIKRTRSMKRPPTPLNTVELESLASKYLNIRAKRALDIAEELYRRGFISYPRTETEIYPPAIIDRLKAFINYPGLGGYVKHLIEGGAKPTAGTKDDKAHPPIHPIKAAVKEEVQRVLGIDGWRLYELVVRHFIATFSKPAQLESKKYIFNLASEKFTYSTLEVINKGFLEIYDYEHPRENQHLLVNVGAKVHVLTVEIKEGRTEPPPYLSESELLKLMEMYGIGTDATMQDHIQTNIDRGYMYIESKRCIPTELGKRLIMQLEKYVPELVKPEVRGMMERELAKIARGEESMESMVSKAKEYFYAQYLKLEERIYDVVQAIAEVSWRSIIEAEKHNKKRRTRKRYSAKS